MYAQKEFENKEEIKKALIRKGETIKLGLPFSVKKTTFTCKDCNYEWIEYYGPLSWLKFKWKGTTCPNCGGTNYRYETASLILSIAVGLSLATLSFPIV